MWARCPDCRDIPFERESCKTCRGMGMVNLRKDRLAEWLIHKAKQGEQVSPQEALERMMRHD